MDKKEYTIKKITEKEIDTKYGRKIKYGVKFEETPDDWIESEWVDVWQAYWNNGWKEQVKVSIGKDQIQERIWESKKYYTITAPPELKGGGSGVVILSERIDNLEADLIKIKKFLREKWGIEQNG